MDGEAKFIRIVREAYRTPLSFVTSTGRFIRAGYSFSSSCHSGSLPGCFRVSGNCRQVVLALLISASAAQLARPFFQLGNLDSVFAIIDKLEFNIKALQPIAGFFAGVTVIEAVDRIHQSIIVIVGATVVAIVIARTRYRDFRRSCG